MRELQIIIMNVTSFVNMTALTVCTSPTLHILCHLAGLFVTDFLVLKYVGSRVFGFD